MEKRNKKVRQMLAVLLSLAMIITMLPGMAVPGKAASGTTRAGENVNFVSMPITIRDYAADGMLFQWNELGTTGDQVVGAALATPTVKYTGQAGGGEFSATVENGYVRYKSNSDGLYLTYTVGNHSRTSMRYAVVKYRVPTTSYTTKTPTIGHRWSGGDNYVDFPKTGYGSNDFISVVIDLGAGDETVNYVTLYPRITNANGNYIDIAEVAFFSSESDANTYASGTATGGATYHHGSTRGYGLLQTIAADHFNDLTDSAAISGTTLTQNGSWSDTPDTITSSNITLNSGAKQTLYGCYVRTNLVEPRLDANKKPVYTEATVTYLANYMQKTLPEVWKNADGTYNMWHVMGTKLFNDNNEYVGNTSSATRDLATVLRNTINGGLGSYANTKGKTLGKVTDCTTYFDAAYFLLHNIYSDNDGYGQTVTEYSTLQMVEKVVDGKSYYVYNSAYDGTEYDLANKTIYNTQTDTITTREGQTYVRGNKQAESRFDPIGAIGDGNQYYGKNGDIYAKAVGDTGNDKYYNATNYNLTLEGHAQFIYYDDADLYFNFTGDDDVYLYINGIRVLDMGGAHAISKCGISLNDVRDLCGLKDGEVYDFDFYYMERHGTAANFGIETNIKIVDPSMLTTKTGYQNGGEVGYNGYVDPQKPVQYQFGLQNNGDATIQNLTFRDDDIGVTLTKDSISLNSETQLKDLVVTKYDASGKVAAAYKDMTDEATLKQVLADGLEIGEKLTIYGFKYTIPGDKWNNNNSFVNHVYTTGESTGDNASKQTLNGTADYKVQKQDYTFTPLHYYDWGTLDTSEGAVTGLLTGGKSKSVTATKEELLKAVTDAGVTVSSSENAAIELCTPSGGNSGNINSKATINASDGSITYTGDRTGTDSYYYLVKDGTAVYGPVRVDVYTYGVADNIYVLDYSLPVELNDTTVGENGVQTGFTANDVVSLGSSNPNVTEWSMTAISDATSNYGIFEQKDQSLTYTMNKIMNDEDSVQVAVEVKEQGAESVTKTTGVTMTQKITTAPASVVYYEDTFAGITYVGNDGNQWVTYETVDSEGNMQSADQDSNYGSDPNYDADKQDTLTANTGNLTEEEKEKAEKVIETVGGTLEGDASNGTITATKVNTTGEILNFEFDGTGFEIVSRTTSNDYAVLSVKVTYTENGEEKVAKQFPVITECVNGDLYQVPVISVKDLPAAHYKVSLSAAKSTETATRIVYIDGIRIYGALEGKTLEITNEDGTKDTVDKTDEYYSDDEKDAVMTQVKTLINEGKIAYADVDYDDDSNPILVSGTTMIEDYNKGSGFVLMEDSLDEYLTFGPNNELYLDGTSATAIIEFYVRPISDDAKTRTIQIGVHRKNSSEGSSESVNMVYGSSAEQIVFEDAPSYAVQSGTEQYYTIDTSELTLDEKGRYLVLIGTDGGDNLEENTLSITNLKLSGYELSSCEEEIQKEDSALLNEARTFRSLRVVEEDPIPEETINENLSITSAKFKTTKVVSGKSVTLSVVATDEADSISITDKDGNEVTVDKSSKKEKKGSVNFTFVWEVTGQKGEELTYTVRAKDASGALSVNEETVSIKVR